MKRRDFFKGLAGVIAGFAVLKYFKKPVSIVISDYEKALREKTDKQAEHLAEVFITNPTFTDWTDDMPNGWSYNGPIESKEMFELRKAINRPITDKLVKKIING